jgi:ABC-2 type transport system ATP-binding protein
MLKIVNGKKLYKGRVVLDNINLEFKQNKCYALVGTNGSGKTLILKALCGYIKLTAGEVFQDEVRIRKDKDFITDAGILIESPEMISDYSILENLKLIAKIKNEITEKEILEYIKLFNLEKHKDTKFKNCSLGTKQKARIIQSIMEKNKILIIDEPFNGLDSASAEKFRKFLLEYKKNNLIILTSHNKSDIDLLADELIYIEEGEIK